MAERTAAWARAARSPGAVRRFPKPVIDALLGAAVSLALALIIATSEEGARPTGWIAYLFALGFGLLMLLRRRMPRWVLVLSVLGVFAYYTLDYPPIGVAVPVIAALFSAAEIGLTGWAIGAAGVVFVVSMFFRILDGDQAIGFLLGYETVSNLALFTAAIALGYSMHTRRARAAQQAEIVRLTEEQLTGEAEARAQAEREQLSRELHDTVGHTLSVISLQAGVAAEAVGRDDRAATDAVERIRSASNRSLKDLRSMVRILRSADDRHEARHLRSLSALPELITTARSTGLEVTTDVSVTPGELSAPVDAAAYRVIQEAITNVIRHADAGRVHVRASIRGGELELGITDDGSGGEAGPAETGYGIVGMRERVRLLGGTFAVRSAPGAGFTVEATIPARLP